ncbi:MAG: hypothetical protein ACXABZ_11945 [Candidatus Thorarchaeota archaeon]
MTIKGAAYTCCKTCLCLFTDRDMVSDFKKNLVSQSFWLKYSSHLSIAMMGIMWLSVSPTLLSYAGL